MSTRRPELFPWLLITMAVLLSAWLVTARLTSGIHAPEHSRPERFTGFFPRLDGWQARTVQVASSAMEPNIMAFALRMEPRAEAPPVHAAPVLVRLVHGYNMVDCMRIKGYRVDAVPHSGPLQSGQIWRMSAPGGRTTIWLTLMLDAADLRATNVDTRAMTFPRIGTPDAPGWNPTGITWSGLRHPVRNVRLWLRSRWNSSRRDLLTFLRLKRAAWVSDRHFALVIEGWTTDMETPDADRIEALQHLLTAMQKQLQAHAAE